MTQDKLHAAFAAQGCKLVRRRLLGVPHSYTMCQELTSGPPGDPTRLLKVQAFFLTQASVLAEQAVGDPQAYVLLHSGRTVRKRAEVHWHLFIITSRRQKAWLYSALAARHLWSWLATTWQRSPPSSSLRQRTQ